MNPAAAASAALPLPVRSGGFALRIIQVNWIAIYGTGTVLLVAPLVEKRIVRPGNGALSSTTPH